MIRLGFALVISMVLMTLTLTRALSTEGSNGEARVIMRRLAEMGHGFEGHDLAKIHLSEGQGQRETRLTKRDLRALRRQATDEAGGAHAFQADLQSSGATLKLTLTPADIVDADTVVSYLTPNGSVERREGGIAHDCYSYGNLQDSSGGEGWAAISHCDGVFGFAQSTGYEYFFQPVDDGSGRSKREANQDGDFHVFWRRLANGEEESTGTSSPGNVSTATPTPRSPRAEESDSDATGIVIELAMFSDEHYWNRLQRLYPGREDDFLLTRLAGTQALYSDRQKVGYDVKIKLKLLEYWTVDPEGYNFTENFSNNLRLSCEYTVERYSYDLHALNTGIEEWNDGRIGLAYTSAACTQHRCLVTNSVDLNSFVGFAHEVGHTLGMNHLDVGYCPTELKSIGGFMGGGVPLNFSPCMKYQLEQFLSSSKSSCLFTEASETKVPVEYVDTPSAFPGQVNTPDELCRILAGPGYNFGPHERPEGTAICKWFVCLNENETSPEFGRARKFTAPLGFPCREDSYCEKDKSCRPWSYSPAEKFFENVRSRTPAPVWSEWPEEVSHCSRTCGTGVRTRRRTCQMQGFNISPQCPGMVVKPELCNAQPCPGESTRTSESELRQRRGNEVCSNFLQKGVSLNLKGADSYLPISDTIGIRDVGPNLDFVFSQSCLLKCRRDPVTSRGDLDAVMPDGTLCLDIKRSRYELSRLNVEMRCVRGLCLEFSDCPDPLEIKDECGICGGDGSRCVTLVFDSLNFVERKQRAMLAIIPAGATNVDVYTNRDRNFGVILELWSTDGQNVIGNGGLYSRKADYGAVPWAGTGWEYRRREAYMRAHGQLREAVMVQVIRLANPIHRISISYALPAF